MEISSNFLDINTIKTYSYDNIKNNNNIKTDKALKDTCDSFESFFMNQILEISLKSSNMAGSGTGSKIVQSMYTDALSQESAGSLGVSELLYQYLQSNNVQIAQALLQEYQPIIDAILEDELITNTEYIQKYKALFKE